MLWLEPEIERGRSGKASFASWQQGIGASIQIGVQSRKRAFPAGNIGELAISIPAPVLQVMKALFRQYIHKIECVPSARVRFGNPGLYRHGQKKELTDKKYLE